MLKGITVKLEGVHEVTVSPGECLTIWARDSLQRTNLQVEIRVSLNGEVLIFCDEPVHPFSEWESLTTQAVEREGK